MNDPIVRVRDVVHDVGPVRALDGVSLEVPAGIFSGMLGPNGAGDRRRLPDRSWASSCSAPAYGSPGSP